MRFVNFDEYKKSMRFVNFDEYKKSIPSDLFYCFSNVNMRDRDNCKYLFLKCTTCIKYNYNCTKIFRMYMQ